MLFISIMEHYFLWHYSRAFKEIFHLWLNFLWFVTHYFSIPQLSKSLFSPWKRIVEKRGKRWSFEDLASYIIIGLLSRVVGFIIRAGIILIGIICLLITALAGLIVFATWTVIPLLIISLLGFGITLLIT